MHPQRANIPIQGLDRRALTVGARVRFFDAWKKVKDPVHATVAFAAIDEDMDGMITRDEYVNAAIEHQFNFTDETKRSKHFFGPLVKD